MTPQYIHIDEDGGKFYYKNKEMTIRHREDGPAFEFNGYEVWFLDGVQYTKEKHAQRTAKTMELTMDQIAEKFGIPVEKLKIVKN
jgi:hypothetical protein